MTSKETKEKGAFAKSYLLKVIFIIVLILFFLIPFQMIRGIVRERRERQQEAYQEITSLWGGEQTIGGPFIYVPYRYFITEVDERGNRKQKEIISHFFIMPDRLNVNGAMSTEIRSRGIFDVPVYQTDIQLGGSFKKSELPAGLTDDGNIMWDQAGLHIELPEMRSIQPETGMTWNGDEGEFTSDSGRLGAFYHGLVYSLPRGWQRNPGNEFDITLKLRGATTLNFIPYGKETTVHIESDWAAPSFTGAFLPSARSISENGFTADWSVHALARNFPQTWKKSEYGNPDVTSSAFGVELFMPLDPYAKTERSLKYGVLFIFLPFLAFFLFELFTKKRLHLLQYLMVGAANTVFYLLLLSLSEHIGFDIAYLIGAIVTTLLIFVYSQAVLATRRQGLYMIPIIGGLYLFLYTILQSEDYALLIGSIGLFAVLAAVMIFTRKVEWSNLGSRNGTDKEVRVTGGLSG